MKSMKFIISLFLIAGLMGCSTALVKSDFDHEFNFAGQQTFAWKAQPQKSDSGYYAYNSLFEKRLKEVTLTLDLLNPDTKELIWRGWYVDTVEDVNLQEEKITEAVKHILEKFPPERKDGHAPVRITLKQGILEEHVKI